MFAVKLIRTGAVFKVRSLRTAKSKGDTSNLCCVNMIYQVLINFEKKNKPIEVADDETKFNKTTILDLKRKFKEKIPGAPSPDAVRVIFGTIPLEDHLTFSFYKIKHLSVLLIVMKMPGGDLCS